MTPDPAGPSVLRPFQVEVARAFFGTPGAAGFLLAGGAALLAQGLTRRPTKDLDFFTSPGRGDVGQALVAMEAVCKRRAWNVRRVRVTETFVRIVVTSAQDSVEVDLAVDATPGRPPVVTMAGPTLGPLDLAGRKVLALFGRAEARDFVDVRALAQRYGEDTLLALAQESMQGSTSASSRTCLLRSDALTTPTSLHPTLPKCEPSPSTGLPASGKAVSRAAASRRPRGP